MPATRRVEIDNTGAPVERTTIDHGMLVLNEKELKFFKEQTGLADTDELIRHILRVQEEAYELFPYPCIRRFIFTQLKISEFPAYQDVLILGKTRNNAIYLDVGCCFGNDIRTVIADGYPRQNVVALDLRRGFWDLGHKLFRSSDTTLPVVFIEGDIFKPAILEPSPPVHTVPSTPPPSLLHLGNSLNPLKGHVSVIHASSLFHLCSEEQQSQLARCLGALLSPQPGSIILGSHVGLRTAGVTPKENTLMGYDMFCHSPESWCALWDGSIFEKGTVTVHATLNPIMPIRRASSAEEVGDIEGQDRDERYRALLYITWSVKRL
ncbi:hypothetical protein K439DRAFT_1336384 [Ramaria rubella]|nr:hypothetical protein K439DRAFT_1336384 [Ramaria rubella]